MFDMQIFFRITDPLTFREVEFTGGEVNNSIAALRCMPPNARGNESRHSDSARASMRIV